MWYSLCTNAKTWFGSMNGSIPAPLSSVVKEPAVEVALSAGNYRLIWAMNYVGVGGNLGFIQHKKY